jgi:ribonuclease P protein component
MVVHWAAAPGSPGEGEAAAEEGCVRVGFVVSKVVGNAVTRNRVARRLRHLVAPRLSGLPAGGVLVVRALAPAAAASSTELSRDLDQCLQRAVGASAA